MVGGRDSAVGVATRQGWAAWGSNPGRSKIFRAVPSGPKAHPAPCTVGTGSLLGVKRPKRGAYHSPPCSAGLGMGWSYTFASLPAPWPPTHTDFMKLEFALT